jgi:uncharacterized protein (DUF305 family)
MFKRKLLIALTTLMATNMLYAAEVSSTDNKMSNMSGMEMKKGNQDSIEMQKEMDSLMQAMHKEMMNAKTPEEMQKVMKDQMQMMNKMMVKELGPKDTNYEQRFMDIMIEHHEGAIMMAKDALKNANKPELIQMAKDIITAQEKEITQMKEWRKQWYNQ